MKLSNDGKTATFNLSIAHVICCAEHHDLAMANFKLSEDQAESILENIVNGYDLTIGISWDVIANYIDSYMGDL